MPQQKSIKTAQFTHSPRYPEHNVQSRRRKIQVSALSLVREKFRFTNILNVLVTVGKSV